MKDFPLGLSLSKPSLFAVPEQEEGQGFDKLSPNGV
jgi:hypothetical protein